MLDAYAVRREGFSSEVEDLVMHFIVTCNDEVSVAADKSLTYREVLIASVAVLKVIGGNIIICSQKPQNYVGANAVLVTVGPRTVSQKPVF